VCGVVVLHTHIYTCTYAYYISGGGGARDRLSHVWNSCITHILHFKYGTNIYIYTHTYD
jgi:hypothetical protein